MTLLNSKEPRAPEGDGDANGSAVNVSPGQLAQPDR